EERKKNGEFNDQYTWDLLQTKVETFLAMFFTRSRDEEMAGFGRYGSALLRAFVYKMGGAYQELDENALKTVLLKKISENGEEAVFDALMETYGIQKVSRLLTRILDSKFGSVFSKTADHYDEIEELNSQIRLLGLNDLLKETNSGPAPYLSLMNRFIASRRPLRILNSENLAQSLFAGDEVYLQRAGTSAPVRYRITYRFENSEGAASHFKVRSVEGNVNSVLDLNAEALGVKGEYEITAVYPLVYRGLRTGKYSMAARNEVRSVTGSAAEQALILRSEVRSESGSAEATLAAFQKRFFAGVISDFTDPVLEPRVRVKRRAKILRKVLTLRAQRNKAFFTRVTDTQKVLLDESKNSAMRRAALYQAEGAWGIEQAKIMAPAADGRKLVRLSDAEAGIAAMTPIEKTWFFKWYADLGAFEDVVRFYEIAQRVAPTDDFTLSREIQTSYVYALNRLALKDIQDIGRDEPFTLPRYARSHEVLGRISALIKQHREKIEQDSGVAELKSLLRSYGATEQPITKDRVPADLSNTLDGILAKANRFFRGAPLDLKTILAALTDREAYKGLKDQLALKVNQRIPLDLHTALGVAHKNLFLLALTSEKAMALSAELPEGEEKKQWGNRLNRWNQLFQYPLDLSDASAASLKLHKVREDALEASRKNFDMSYEAYVLDSYAGTNYVRSLLYQGDYETAKAYAPAVRAAAGLDVHTFWGKASQFEMSLVLGDTNQTLKDLASLLQNPKFAANRTELQSLLLHLETWKTLNDERGISDPLLAYVTAVLKKTVNPEQGVEGGLDAGFEAILLKSQVDQASLSDLSRKVEDASIQQELHTRGIVLPNNANRGGIVPDYISNDADSDLVRAFLEYSLPGKGRLIDMEPKKFNETLNDLIEDIFHLVEVRDGKKIRVLRNLKSPEHKDFDAFFEAFLFWVGARESGMSGTSLSAAAALGIGDCRPTNYFKQRIAGGYRKYRLAKRIRALTAEIDSRFQGSKNPGYADALHNLQNKRQRKMVVFDVEIHAPIKVNGLYDVEYKEDGPDRVERPVRADNDAHVENHTLAAELEYDKSGVLRAVILRDVWYKFDDDNTSYDFGARRIPITDIREEAGALILPVKNGMKAYAESGELVDLDVTLKLSKYSKDSRRKVTHRYYDDGTFLGGHLVESLGVEYFLEKGKDGLARVDHMYQRFVRLMLDWKKEEDAARSEVRKVEVRPGATQPVYSTEFEGASTTAEFQMLAKQVYEILSMRLGVNKDSFSREAESVAGKVYRTKLISDLADILSSRGRFGEGSLLHFITASFLWLASPTLLFFNPGLFASVFTLSLLWASVSFWIVSKSGDLRLSWEVLSSHLRYGDRTATRVGSGSFLGKPVSYIESIAIGRFKGLKLLSALAHELTHAITHSLERDSRDRESSQAFDPEALPSALEVFVVFEEAVRQKKASSEEQLRSFLRDASVSIERKQKLIEAEIFEARQRLLSAEKSISPVSEAAQRDQWLNQGELIVSADEIAVGGIDSATIERYLESIAIEPYQVGRRLAGVAMGWYAFSLERLHSEEAALAVAWQYLSSKLKGMNEEDSRHEVLRTLLQQGDVALAQDADFLRREAVIQGGQKIFKVSRDILLADGRSVTLTFEQKENKSASQTTSGFSKSEKLKYTLTRAAAEKKLDEWGALLQQGKAPGFAYQMVYWPQKLWSAHLTENDFKLITDSLAGAEKKDPNENHAVAEWDEEGPGLKIKMWRDSGGRDPRPELEGVYTLLPPTGPGGEFFLIMPWLDSKDNSVKLLLTASDDVLAGLRNLFAQKALGSAADTARSEVRTIEGYFDDARRAEVKTLVLSIDPKGESASRAALKIDPFLPLLMNPRESFPNLERVIIEV
ncbi:MAG: hypothetical protein KBC91_04865, partial [Candidatus Omnitrophica bacterium]|nr:hypothetical protein [Candidatus Omnitrophota bacterium]